MNKSRTLIVALGAIGMICITGVTQAAVPTLADDVVIQREASEGPRGGDNERPGDRQRRGGKRLIEDGRQDSVDLAREGAASGGGRQRQRHGGERLIEDGSQSTYELAREASEGPRGGDNERPGDRQRRGGKRLIEDGSQSTFELAREGGTRRNRGRTGA